MADLIGDIDWFRGDSYPLTLTIKNKKTKEVIDITGYSFILTVDSEKDPVNTSTKIFSVVGVLSDTPINGVVTFTPSALATNFINNMYYFDIQMTDASGNIRTIAKYKWKQSQDITK